MTETKGSLHLRPIDSGLVEISFLDKETMQINACLLLTYDELGRLLRCSHQRLYTPAGQRRIYLLDLQRRQYL